jgi:hypothetical protein
MKLLKNKINQRFRSLGNLEMEQKLADEDYKRPKLGKPCSEGLAQSWAHHQSAHAGLPHAHSWKRSLLAGAIAASLLFPPSIAAADLGIKTDLPGGGSFDSHKPLGNGPKLPEVKLPDWKVPHLPKVHIHFPSPGDVLKGAGKAIHDIGKSIGDGAQAVAKGVHNFCHEVGAFIPNLLKKAKKAAEDGAMGAWAMIKPYLIEYGLVGIGLLGVMMGLSAWLAVYMHTLKARVPQWIPARISNRRTRTRR